MKALDRPINFKAMSRKVDVDHRIPLRNYYRIADNLLKQASIYREENNLVDLYIILLRFSSLMSETIPFHRDYQVLLPREKAFYKKKLWNVMDELESLKPTVQPQVDELNKALIETRRGSHARILHNSEASFTKTQSPSDVDIQRLNSIGRNASQSSWKRNDESNEMFSSNLMQIDKQFHKISVSLPLPKEETLSRHSILGRNGLRGQWLGPSTGIKVQYPSSADIIPADSSLNQAGQYGVVTEKDSEPGGNKLIMDSVLSLDDGRWRNQAESCSSEDIKEDLLHMGNIRQPSPPAVLTQVHQAYLPVSPSKVADPRPGPAKLSQEGPADANSYQQLHIPVKMMEDFLRLAQTNTKKNLETCGVLAGSLRNRVFYITTLIIPKQESTSDSCQTMNEEEIFEFQDRRSLFPLGWIHTHPSQTCFMSSVDLHTHYSYQIMLPEAIAIVMAPTDTSSPHGIFHLSDPGGVSVIRNCQQRGFHPHEEPDDGSPIYEHCSHVYMNPTSKFDVVDLR
ncbi:Amsh-like ubiquitin thioesterase [Thalictrum thalictroides]|uniref:Amsh-like ubiquitin thioesterase n=1 Tax=Thalictrum thalictroides TaxID=46969 RepID=A0A7J6W458_THATH|nr:Amsh-like ubiquitin thioesterase [Thalictrum thalictroides]